MPVTLPKVGDARGAPMGRPSSIPHDIRGKVRLARVRINCGGYDAGGAYWGRGAPLYQARDESGQAAYFRALGRASALTIARAFWPAAKVMR